MTTHIQLQMMFCLEQELKDGLWESYMVCALIPHKMLVTKGPKRTLYGLMDAIVASFNLMSVKGGGTMPSDKLPGCSWGQIDQAEAGKRIAGGWFFEYLGTKGDLEFKRDVFGWIDTGRYYACLLHCCAHCFASCVIPELAYDDFRRDAAHKKTKVSTKFLLQNTKAGHVMPLMKLSGWLHELDCDDLLHCLFQGIAQDLTGSVLVVLGEAHFYDAIKKALEHQWEFCRLELKDFCQVLSTVLNGAGASWLINGVPAAKAAAAVASR